VEVRLIKKGKIMSKRETVVITGGYGFIGSNLLVRLLNDNKYRVINIDKLTYVANPEFVLSNVPNMPDDYVFINTNIVNIFAMRDIMAQADYVIHLAAESSVDRSLSAPLEFVKSNIEGTLCILEALKGSDRLKKMIYISTDEVCGSIDEGYFTEESPFHPQNPYAASKASGEMFVMAYAHTFNIPIVTTRSCNNYGPNQYPEKLMPVLVTNALKNEHLPICGDGSNIRSWIHVNDNVEALLLLLEKGKVGEVYNVGTFTEVSNLDMAKQILSYLNKPESLIEFIEDRKGNDKRYAVDSYKLRKLGWHPSISFEDGLHAYIEYIKEFGR
jgi:dTDP-glucose 4,6-dehydratase